MTIKETLKYGCDILEKNGIGEAGIDAWNLFEYITGINRTQYFLYPDKEPKEMPNMKKSDLARHILKEVIELVANKQS